MRKPPNQAEAAAIAASDTPESTRAWLQGPPVPPSRERPRLFLSKGNSKLVKTGKVLSALRGRKVTVHAFNLPAGVARQLGPDGKPFLTCPGAAACLAVCYAQQGRFMVPAAVKVREDNLSFVRAALAAGTLTKDLFRMLDAVKSGDVVRLHDSGDFFSAEYAYAWFGAAMLRHDVLFYAYTKSIPALAGLDVPRNVVITYSEGGRWDDRIPDGAGRSRIFSSHAAREAAGYRDGNSHDGDLPAIEGAKRIGLVYHGVKTLTPKQTAYFGFSGRVARDADIAD